jgi:hypothetical protein
MKRTGFPILISAIKQSGTIAECIRQMSLVAVGALYIECNTIAQFALTCQNFRHCFLSAECTECKRETILLLSRVPFPLVVVSWVTGALFIVFTTMRK